MRLSVDKAFMTVRSLGLLKPRFCVKVLSLYQSASDVSWKLQPILIGLSLLSIDSTYLSHVLEKVLAAPTGKVPVVVVLFL